jgi:DNA mismatch endonuclease, patch repair protein
MPTQPKSKALPHRSRRPPWPDVPEGRRRIMRAIRPKDTGPEHLVRSTLHSMGYRFRVHGMKLSGRPDIVFRSRRKAVFVHGCFWHAHGCNKTRPPRTRTEYWLRKLRETKRRDLDNQKRLIALGWKILVLWECELGEPSLIARLRTFLGPTAHRREHASHG